MNESDKVRLAEDFLAQKKIRRRYISPLYMKILRAMGHSLPPAIFLEDKDLDLCVKAHYITRGCVLGIAAGIGQAIILEPWWAGLMSGLLGGYLSGHFVFQFIDVVIFKEGPRFDYKRLRDEHQIPAWKDFVP